VTHWKIDALDQWCLRRILDIRWYRRVSNWEVQRLTEQPLLTLSLRPYIKEDSCCLDTWSEWMSQPTPGEFWLQFPRVIGEGQLDDPTPPGWPLWRTTYLCTTSPLRMLSKWPLISCCGDYWQQAELLTDDACRIMMMMTHCSIKTMFSDHWLKQFVQQCCSYSTQMM